MMSKKLTPYSDLPEDARLYLDAMFEAYFNQTGLPPGLDYETTKSGLIGMIEAGRAEIITDGDSFTIRITDAGKRIYGLKKKDMSQAANGGAVCQTRH